MRCLVFIGMLMNSEYFKDNVNNPVNSINLRIEIHVKLRIY